MGTELLRLRALSSLKFCQFCDNDAGRFANLRMITMYFVAKEGLD